MEDQKKHTRRGSAAAMMEDWEGEVEPIRTLLRDRVRQSKVTRAELAQRVELSRSAVNKTLRSGGSRLTVERLLTILNAIGVTPAEFYRDLYGWPRSRAGRSFDR